MVSSPTFDPEEDPGALRMKRPDLPVYYYHDHFVEMLAFVRATYGPILTDEHDAFVKRFQHLSKVAMPADTDGQSARHDFQSIAVQVR